MKTPADHSATLATLLAYQSGTLPAAEAMRRLGVDWPGDLLRLMAMYKLTPPLGGHAALQETLDLMDDLIRLQQPGGRHRPGVSPATPPFPERPIDFVASASTARRFLVGGALSFQDEASKKALQGRNSAMVASDLQDTSHIFDAAEPFGGSRVRSSAFSNPPTAPNSSTAHSPSAGVFQRERVAAGRSFGGQTAPVSSDNATSCGP